MQQDALLGETLDGKYHLGGVLGRGGMGVVYQATHLHTRRAVALKLIAPRFVAEPEFVERFRREAQAAGQVRHAGVVDVTDFGFAETSGGRVAYLVMELLEGVSLEEVLRQEGRLPARFVADVLEQVGSAVSAAHRRGIVHRDLKPANLWLEPDRRGGYTVKVLDFGLAKLAEIATEPAPAAGIAEIESPTRTWAGGPANLGEDDETLVNATTPAPPLGLSAPELTRVGATLGTPLYMSPEQCAGQPADARSDIYSLGVIAYRMLAGRTPFVGTESELIRQHLSSLPPPLAETEAPRAVAELVRSALDKDPARRPLSAIAFGAAFAARTEGAGVVLRQVLTLFVAGAREFLGFAGLALLPILLAVIFAALLPELLRRFLVLPAILLASLLWLAGQALCQPLVAQLLATPLRRVGLRPLLRSLRPRLREYARFARMYFGGFARLMLPIWVLTEAAGPLLVPLTPIAWRGPVILLLVAPAIITPAVWWVRSMDAHEFAAAAIVMEGLSSQQAAERSRELARASKRHLPGFERLRMLILLPALAACGSWYTSDFVPSGGLDAASLWLIGIALALLVPMLVATLALVLVSNALLYFKARQSAGEPLTEALAQFERAALPGGNWQQQLRERIHASTRV